MIKRLWNNGLLLGGLVGLLLTLPLMAVFYLGEQMAGLPFVPFATFDWISKLLPGDIVAGTIQAMISVIEALNLGQTDIAGEAIERLMALGLFVALGVVAGALFFYLLRRRGAQASDLAGLLLGAIVGLPIIVGVGTTNPAFADNAVVNAVWMFIAFMAWGAAFAWVYDRIGALDVAAAQAVSPPEAAATVPGAPASLPSKAAYPAASVQVMDRRQFLIRLGGATAAITVMGAGLGALFNGAGEALRTEPLAEVTGSSGLLPNANAAVGPAPGTRSEITPVNLHYKIDIPLRSPDVDGETWRLNLFGLVDNPLALTLEDIRDNYQEAIFEEYITLACISNRVGGDLIGTTRWTGVSLRRVLQDAGLQSGAAYLIIRSADGFYETLDLELVNADERIMLAYEWDGQPLTVDHGFPLRVYIPSRYGMKQPKWITEIEVVAEYQRGYWVDRGWDREAIMRATSVIDTVAADALIERDGQTLVPIGGIAHAGARGISKVEVSVDDGEWVEAQLRTPLSDLTWVVWRYDWPFAAGTHTFTVRCYDGMGEMQITEDAPPRPSGATGIHRLPETLYS